MYPRPAVRVSPCPLLPSFPVPAYKTFETPGRFYKNKNFTKVFSKDDVSETGFFICYLVSVTFMFGLFSELCNIAVDIVEKKSLIDTDSVGAYNYYRKLFSGEEI